MAKIVVVGAGVVGATSAFTLARAGHRVTLVDRNEGPCLGASQRNGAQLSYGYCDALGSPSFVKQLPGILLGSDPAYSVRMQLDPEFLLWGLKFLGNSTKSSFLKNTETLLEMAAVTKRLLADIIVEYDLNFQYRIAGKMVLIPTQRGIAASRTLMDWKAKHGIVQQFLTREEAMQIEPAIALYADTIAGVVYSPEDAVGDPGQFCDQLINIAKVRFGLRTRFGLTAKKLLTNRGKVTAVQLDKEDTEECDVVVVSTGIGSSLVSRVRPGYATVWPVQGYSITIPACDKLFNTSITDTKRKLVFARLGNELRVAGIADLGERDLVFNTERLAALTRSASDAFNLELNYKSQNISPWSGARPCTPSSVPIIKQMKTKGVYANYGHGTLGWTVSLGAAQILLEAVTRNHSFSSSAG